MPDRSPRFDSIASTASITLILTLILLAGGLRGYAESLGQPERSDSAPAATPSADRNGESNKGRLTNGPSNPKSTPTPRDESSATFPVNGLLPKEEIGALRFLAEHPEFDGRGTVVAIFDTGVDPGAAGLQETSTGEPKIVDLIDGTGSGDVDTTTIQEATENRLEGLSGRTLNLSPDWKNPTGEFHLGLKRAYDFFPQRLITRLKEERRREFDRQQRMVETRLRKELEAWDAAHPVPSPADLREREDLHVRLEQLIEAGRNFEDPGPLFDCVVFHDGDCWRAVIDTDEDGNLTNEQLLTNFRNEREFGSFGNGALLNFAVNIYDEGRRLSIVTDSGAHGTHVAGIVAGYFPDRPELNGVAPGARIVSVKIGDSRLGTMETGAALERGLKAVRDHRCDLINMSYGEPTSTPNRGRLIELFSELVDERGVVFVASAGNSGPALSTVGAPGGTTSSILGIGAYLSPEMRAALYGMRTDQPEMPYTWSSRGPTFDGDRGVDLFAPGGALASVPNWMLRRGMPMNGTSMASPNACGGIALLISGLKAQDIPYSPASVRRALENTARPCETGNVFAQGAGLLQVDRAFEWITDRADRSIQRLRFEVSLPARGNARGIYLREPAEVERQLETSVRVRPVFRKSDEKRAQLDLEARIALRCNAEWVSTGDYLILANGVTTFSVHVDPTDLPPGVHAAEIQGVLADDLESGPLFRVPVTVVRPHARLDAEATVWSEELVFEPGEATRRFFAVPTGATWAELTVRRRSEPTLTSGRRRFLVHAVQCEPGKSFRDSQFRTFLTLGNQEPLTRGFAVAEGRMLELCLAEYWSNESGCAIEYTLRFHGLAPDAQRLTLSPSDRSKRVEVKSLLGTEVVSPTARLEQWRTHLSPEESTVRALDPERDQLPDGSTIYELNLAYRFDQPRPGTVTIRFPQTDGLLYDSPFGTQLWLLYDGGKRRIAADDVWPNPIQVGRGPHTVRLQLRHEEASRLESVREMPMCIDRPLPKPLVLDVYASEDDLLNDSRKFRRTSLSAGERTTLFLAPPQPNQIPSEAKPGDLLIGTIRYGEADRRGPGTGCRPGGYPLQWFVSAVSKNSPSSSSGSKSNNDNSPIEPQRSLSEEVRDFRVGQLQRLIKSRDREQFETLCGELLSEFPDHLPILVARLHWLDRVDWRKEHLPEVVQAADTVLERIDRDQLARHFGNRINGEAEEERNRDRQLKAERATLIDTLYRKGRALGYMELPDVIEVHPIADPAAHDRAFEANFEELSRWVDTTESDYFLLHIRRERRRGRLGEALKVLNRHMRDAAPNYWHVKKRMDLYEWLEWPHLWEAEQKWLLIRFPDEFEPL